MLVALVLIAVCVFFAVLTGYILRKFDEKEKQISVGAVPTIQALLAFTSRPSVTTDAPQPLARPPSPSHAITLMHMDGDDEVRRQITVARKTYRIMHDGVAYDHCGEGIYWPSSGQGVKR